MVSAIRFDDLVEITAKSFIAVEKRFDHIDQRFDKERKLTDNALSSITDLMERRFKVFQHRFDQIDNDILYLHSSTKNIQEQLSYMNQPYPITERLSRLERAVFKK